MSGKDKTRDDLVAEIATLRERIARLEAAKAQTEGPMIAAAAPPKIFVAIASYCDPVLPRTLSDCIENARHPEQLRFGICWQYDSRQPVDISAAKADKRFRFAEYPIEESQGGPWARMIAQGFWDGEPYTLQVDSHMKFEPGWDAKLVDMIRRLPSDKPLITVNSPLFWYDDEGRLHRQIDKGIRTTKVALWDAMGDWAPWFDWGEVSRQNPGRSRFISGNFAFTLGQWNEEVPQDPAHYYWGEEFNLTVRSYTHGYDLFLPREIVAWHMNHRDGPPRRHWEHGQDVVDQKNEIAFERLRLLIYSDDAGDQQKLGRYGLGTKRSKRDYEIYAGMDFKRKKAHPDVFTGKNPDPVTIKTETDWQRCMTIEEHRRMMAAVEAVERMRLGSASTG